MYLIYQTLRLQFDWNSDVVNVGKIASILGYRNLAHDSRMAILIISYNCNFVLGSPKRTLQAHSDN